MQAQPESGFSEKELEALNGYDLTQEILDSVSEAREGLEELMGRKLTALEVYKMEWDKGSHPRVGEVVED
jgi:hypothetical protein